MADKHSLANAVDADLRALLALTGDRCLWLDSGGHIRRAQGEWPTNAAHTPMTAVPASPTLGTHVAQLLPADTLAQLQRSLEIGSTVLWTVHNDNAEQRFELRLAALTGGRQLLVARELESKPDGILTAECERLRARVYELDRDLQALRDAGNLLRVRLEEEVERAARRADPVSVLRLDLHDLSRYEERFGSAATTDVLVTVDRTLRRDARAGDYLARWQRAGFAMVLPNTDQRAARLVAERHQRGIGAIHWPHADIGVRAGLATLWRDANDADELLTRSQPVH